MRTPPLPGTESAGAGQYAWIANADPVTGIPAIIGEVWEAGDLAGADRRPAGRRSGTPLDAIRATSQALHASCVELAGGATLPTHQLLRLHGDLATVVREEPLSLTPEATLRYLYGEHERGRIDDDVFLARTPPAALAPSRGRLRPGANRHLVAVAHGVPCSGAPATGVLSPDSVREGAARTIVLVDRVEAQHTALLHDSSCAGILAVRGSPADHFTILAREAGCGYATIPGAAVEPTGLRCGEALVGYGTPVTVDFSDGRVFTGTGVLDREPDDAARSALIRVLANRPPPFALKVSADAPDALEAGMPPDAAGVGLLRIEHLLRLRDLTGALERAFDAADESDRQRREPLAALEAQLEPLLARVLRATGDRPVTFRLLDFPLHELDGHRGDEVNPMLGLRGVRQGVRWPDVYALQIRALLRAAAGLRAAGETLPAPELLVPMVCTAGEVRLVRSWLEREADAIPGAAALRVRVGAMLETPAALAAIGSIAPECELASFGTNDLTQLCLGLSREDYVPIVERHRELDLLADDPFVRLHPTVLALVTDAAVRARRACPGMALGMCGNHAADPAAAELVHRGLLDHLSVPLESWEQIKLQALRVAQAAEAA